MKLNKVKLKFSIMILATIVMTTIIFSNSLLDYNASHNSSSAIIGLVTSNGTISEFIELLVRKAAHIVEFFLLGVLVISLILYIQKHYKKTLYGVAGFYVLLVAVIDEHIQSFSDRSSSTADILLDFFGAIIGFSIVLIIHAIILKRARRKLN